MTPGFAMGTAPKIKPNPQIDSHCEANAKRATLLIDRQGSLRGGTPLLNGEPGGRSDARSSGFPTV